MNTLDISEETKNAIKKWESENMFLAGVLQKECLNYWHYVREVLDCIDEEQKK